MQVADGVVSLKAQYGVDINNDCRIDNAEWTTAAPADWTQLLAVRVARAGPQPPVRAQRRSASPAASAPVTPATSDLGSAARRSTFLMTNVDGTPDAFGAGHPDPNNWRYYRYRVYERVIPLRNMIWGKCHEALDRRFARRPAPRRERGVVLFVALIVLIVMTLAGLALLRQMAPASSIAGNIAFKENATSVADRGTEVALQYLACRRRSPRLDSVRRRLFLELGRRAPIRPTRPIRPCSTGPSR